MRMVKVGDIVTLSRPQDTSPGWQTFHEGKAHVVTEVGPTKKIFQRVLVGHKTFELGFIAVAYKSDLTKISQIEDPSDELIAWQMAYALEKGYA